MSKTYRAMRNTKRNKPNQIEKIMVRIARDVRDASRDFFVTEEKKNELEKSGKICAADIDNRTHYMVREGSNV